MKSTWISLVLFSLLFCVSANSTFVSNASDICNTKWFAGDTIIMKNGLWNNQSIILIAEGTAEKAVVLMAETPGKVVLNGSSKLSFSGKFIIISGLFFKDGNLSGSAVISFRTSSSGFAENCRLTNTTIVNYNPRRSTAENKWVSIYGKNNQVDHCTFINKTNAGCLLVVWLQSGIIPNHIIDNNYFGYRNANLDKEGDEINGQEIIRIGDSSTSMQTAGVIVSNNFFERCSGEVEIISNKSCENIYTNNVFYECVGMLTLRHGNRCTVEGNYFFGNGISRTGGVRIIGEDHKVYNNYFENLRGSEFRAALSMVRGIENSPINGYFQVKNAKVVFNTMVNCKQAFSINYNSDLTKTLPPVNSVIAHNHVYNLSENNNNVTIYPVNAGALDIEWKNNVMNQGSYNNFSYTSSELITGVEPLMKRAGTSIDIYEPGPGTALENYKTDEFPEVQIDIRGRSRGKDKIPGASQFPGGASRQMPSRTSAGANFYNTQI